MSPVTIHSTFASARWKTSVALLSLGLVWLLAQPAQAQSGPLSFFKNYFITGDYAVGGTSLWQKGSSDGKAAVEISVPGVPDGADILAAYLYVQTAEIVQWSGIDHAKFNGSDLGPGLIRWRRRSTGISPRRRAGPSRILAAAGWSHTAPTSCGSCRSVRTASRWSAGRTRSWCRIPARRSATLKRAAPRAGAGPGRARSAQAWSWSTGIRRCRFRAVVIYDGGATKTAFATMDQTIAGLLPGLGQSRGQDDAHRR